MSTARRFLPLALALGACAACSSKNSNPVPNNPPGTTCSVGTQVSLSNPPPGATGVAGNIGTIQIVVDANTDLLGTSWNAILVDQFGNKIQGGTLSLTSNHGGYHPFPTDYYYNSSVAQLTSGDVWNVYMNQFTSQCAPLFVGTFGT